MSFVCKKSFRIKMSRQLTFFYKLQIWQLAHIAGKKLLTVQSISSKIKLVPIHVQTILPTSLRFVSLSWNSKRFYCQNLDNFEEAPKNTFFGELYTATPYSYLGTHKSTSVPLNEICVSKTFVYNLFFTPNFPKQNLFVKTHFELLLTGTD